MARFLALSLLPLGVASVLAAQNAPPPALVPAEEYRVRDAVESSFVNLATFPVRPMAFDRGGNLWALNHHDSTIRRFDLLGPTGTTFALPWGPVAVAFWAGTSPGVADDEMIVTCRGSWTVVQLDVTSGAIKYLHQLRPTTADSARQGRMAEPGDIVVVGNQALVTCGGADKVLQINLETKATFLYPDDLSQPPSVPFDAKHPLFLSKDAAGMVYLTPLISGNHTIPIKSGAPPEQSQFGSDDVIRGIEGDPVGLPDWDLFRIDPVGKSLTAVKKNIGTVLFAHGINPVTGKLWLLNTEARNDELNSEPLANGVFARNRITILDLSTLSKQVLLLDEGMPPPPPSEGVNVPNMTGPIGQPYSLTFASNGHAFLCGLLTDNVLELDSAGNFLWQHTITLGSAIPRQVLLNGNQQKLLVYCWGENQVRIYDVATHAEQLPPLSLGHDPTPAALKPGRALFFNARHSRYGNLSCATCHVEGGSDLLSWNLSNVPMDDKGPMVTQTLVGIERMAPFHWRGERSLTDFNGAFKGLLGNPAELDEVSFNHLQNYLFSLTNPANPNQNRRRVLDNTLSTPGQSGGLAIQGQNTFNDTPAFSQGAASCHDCHSMPLGTLADIIDESPANPRPRRAQMKPAPFHELWRKEMRTDDFTVGGLTLPEATFLGTGFTHSAAFADLSTFIENITFQELFPDLAAFVHQFDQGVGQAVHFAFLLNESSLPVAGEQLTVYLLDQAHGRAGDVQGASSRRNCDIVVFGTVKDSSGAFSQRRWYFDRYAYGGVGIFRCEKPDFMTVAGSPNGERSLDQFLERADEGESNVFLGLPVGMGERFGVDYDMDGSYNGDDTAQPYTPGSGSGTVDFQSTGDPVQVLWENSKTARLRFDTTIATRYEVKYWPHGGTPPAEPQVETDVFSRNHTVLLGGLQPSTNHAGPNNEYLAQTIAYDVEVKAIPLAPLNPVTTILENLTTDGFEEFTFSNQSPRQRRLFRNHVIGAMTMSGTGSSRLVTITTAFKRGGNYANGNIDSFRHVAAPNRVVIGRAFKENTVTLEVTPLAVSAGNNALQANSVGLVSPTGSPSWLVVSTPGVPLLISKAVTNSGGSTTIDFNGVALLLNEQLVFSVEAVVEVDPDVWLNTTVSQGVLLLPTVPIVGLPNDPNTPDHHAWSQWSFPDTKEAGAMVRD